MKKKINRRNFLLMTSRAAAGIALLGFSGLLVSKKQAMPSLYQIDPGECTQCGRCATNCVKPISAVKCVNEQSLCGFCDYCYGYYQGEGKNRTLRCPRNAIIRKELGPERFEYTIDEDKCIGCGSCVLNCKVLGNGSMYLRIQHDLCDQCNLCSIADKCPSNAIQLTNEVS